MQLGARTFHANDDFNSNTLFDDVIDILSLLITGTAGT